MKNWFFPYRSTLVMKIITAFSVLSSSSKITMFLSEVSQFFRKWYFFIIYIIYRSYSSWIPVLSIHETVKLYLTRISCSLGTFTGILIQIHSDLLCHPTCSLALVRWIFCKLVALENSRMISKLVTKTPSANVIRHVHAWLLSHCSF